MKSRNLHLLLLLLCTLFCVQGKSQVAEDDLGAWYMYFFTAEPEKGKWGIQGDIQYRNWDLVGDLEQLLLRGGVSYRPDNYNTKLTLGYAHITSGAFGESDETSAESRIYQEATLPAHIGGRLFLTHRFRFEQRFVVDQDFRTRFRYALFITIPLNEKVLLPGTLYLAVYDEVFLNGQREIGNGNTVDVFDRNRLYLGLGYQLSSKLKTQLGFMRQSTENWSKNQLQLSLHHNIL